MRAPVEEFNQPREFLKLFHDIRQAAGDGHNLADDADHEDGFDIVISAMLLESLEMSHLSMRLWPSDSLSCMRVLIP